MFPGSGVANFQQTQKVNEMVRSLNARDSTRAWVNLTWDPPRLWAAYSAHSLLSRSQEKNESSLLNHMRIGARGEHSLMSGQSFEPESVGLHVQQSSILPTYKFTCTQPRSYRVMQPQCLLPHRIASGALVKILSPYL